MRNVIKQIPGYDPFRNADGFWFDEDEAERKLKFFPALLSHVKGELAGKPFMLATWQTAIVANLFGWKRIILGEKVNNRRYRTVFVYVPRKNGKTAMVAGILLCVLFGDGEPGAEVYCAAADRDQATLLFDQARGMVLNNPALDKLVRIYSASKAIVCGSSSFKAISSEANTKHGYNSHCVAIDELHAHKDAELVEVLTTSTGARRQPIVIYLTTADYDRPSICNDTYDYACKVRDGIIDDAAFLPVIYEASPDDDWKSPDVWRKANPNLGVSVSYEHLEAECKKAQQFASFENTFKRLHLNVRTEQDVRWVPVEEWDACTGAIDEARFAGVTCYAGLDLASTSDITAFVLGFPIEGEFHLLPFFWLPEDRVGDSEQAGRKYYRQWVRDGLIRTTPGNMTDYAFVRKQINEIGERFHIKEIAVDRLFQGAQLAMELGQDGFEMVSFGQGFFSMAAPTLAFESLIKSRKVVHGGNPVLRWMLSNCSVEMDAAGNMKLSKKKSEGKIDGIVAAVMALGRMTANEGQGVSIYEKRGLIRL